MNEYLSRVEYLESRRYKGQSSANTWKRDERMEDIAALKESHPETFERMGVHVRLSLGYYENGKKNAAAYGRDVNEGGK